MTCYEKISVYLSAAAITITLLHILIRFILSKITKAEIKYKIIELIERESDLICLDLAIYYVNRSDVAYSVIKAELYNDKGKIEDSHLKYHSICSRDNTEIRFLFTVKKSLLNQRAKLLIYTTLRKKPLSKIIKIQTRSTKL